MVEAAIPGDRLARERVARIEELLGELESAPQGPIVAAASEAIALVVELHGEGLARTIELAGGTDSRLLSRLAEDELICHLLLLHGLHPRSLEERVSGALEQVRPYLESHGGGVELLYASESEVRLSLRGSCSGCPSSAMTLKLAVEDAIRKAAPEVDRIEAEGATGPAPSNLLQIGLPDSTPGPAQTADGPAQTADGPAQTVDGAAQTADGASRGRGEDGTRWETAGGLPQLRVDGKLVQRVAGEHLLFVRAGGRLYAYRPTCAACGSSLEDAALDGAQLSCAHCGAAYDIRRAGRRLDGAQDQLEPVPLLEGDEGLVRVAVGALAA